MTNRPAINTSANKILQKLGKSFDT